MSQTLLVRGAADTIQVDPPHRLEDAFFRSLFESDIAGIAVADLDAALIIEANDRLLEIVGRRREEVVGVHDAWRTMTPAEYHHLDLDALEKVMAGERHEPFEKEYQRPDGTRIAVRVSTSLVPGHPGKLMIVVADLTAQKAREREAANNDEQLRTLADSLPALIGYIDRDMIVRFVNRPYEDWFGCKRDDMIGRPVSEFLSPQTMDNRRAAFEAVLAGRPQTFEDDIAHSDGSIRSTQLQYVPRFDEHGDVGGFYVLVSDITERKTIERELRRTVVAAQESEARFRAMAEAAPVMIWQSGPGGENEYLNPSYLAFFGKTPEQVAEFGWVASEHPDDKDANLAEYFSALQAKRPFEVEARFLDAMGNYRRLHSVGVPRFDAEGAYLGHIGVSRDVTDEREADTQQKLLIDELNHRVKNTLAVVQSLAWQTLRDQAVPRDVRAAFEKRLLALATAHDVLTAKNWNPASIEVIIRTGLAALSIAEDRFTVAGPLLRMPPKTAVSLAMAIHELATNAMKYGSLSLPGGSVVIDWQVDGERFRMAWRERGGPPVIPPQRRGFGTRLLERGLAAELSGKAVVEFDPDGIACTIDAPLPPGAFVVA